MLRPVEEIPIESTERLGIAPKRPPTRYPGPGRMSPLAHAYYAIVVAGGFAAAAVLLPRLHTNGTPTFAVLAAAAALSQLFTVDRPGGQTYKASIAFIIPAAFVLPPSFLVPLAVVQYVPEWVKSRKTIKVLAFNIAKAILDTLAAWTVFHLPWHHVGLGPHEQFALAAVAACATYVLANHLLVALIICLTARQSLRATKLFSLDYLSTDFILAALGGAVAALWAHDAWVVPLAVAPLVLTHRALAIPQLQQEARVDAKTGLFNARHFSKALEDELGRAQRFSRPLALLMADLDLLREINNTHGHLAGDTVITGIADIFRDELRQYDIAGRFGGEEFSILLPETTRGEAAEIAERIRARVADKQFTAGTAREPIRATISIGVATFPEDAETPKELVHRADVAVYLAKHQGRNRVVVADGEQHLVPVPAPRTEPVVSTQERQLRPLPPLPALDLPDELDDLPDPEPVAVEEPRARFLSLPWPLPLVVALVGSAGLSAGVAGVVLTPGRFTIGLLALAGLVAVGQVLSFELAEFEGVISVSAVGSLAGAAIFEYRAALILALAAALIDWAWRRTAIHHFVYNVATLSLASLAAAGVFRLAHFMGSREKLATAGLGLAAGAVYFGINTTLVSVASALARRESPRHIFQERFAWLLQHYVVYGFIGGVIAVAYEAAGLYSLAVFAVPLLLMRRTQQAYLVHTQRSNSKLREAAKTITAQNVSLEDANRLLRERSTAAMESLSATVDARDAYTAGHSRRVQQLVLAIGRELGLTQTELDLLGHAALFHDIGKLAISDSILLKRGPLSVEERLVMQRHAEEGARIIERLGFLQDAVPSIRHHHESWDGTGYPAGLAGDDIPLGARIIHLADALDSMVTTRIYRAARPLEEALDEIRSLSGTQFCPRCVAALERLLPLDPSSVELPALTAFSA
jgi:diguanylate cyclase (GGDEF)-like protein/putative nucleotidyltransferase with HDIG domain